MTHLIPHKIPLAQGLPRSPKLFGSFGTL